MDLIIVSMFAISKSLLHSIEWLKKSCVAEEKKSDVSRCWSISQLSVWCSNLTGKLALIKAYSTNKDPNRKSSRGALRRDQSLQKKRNPNELDPKVWKNGASEKAAVGAVNVNTKN